MMTSPPRNKSQWRNKRTREVMTVLYDSTYNGARYFYLMLEHKGAFQSRRMYDVQLDSDVSFTSRFELVSEGPEA